jgi:fucose 4-O-acetylase-like acetyltransferase
MPLFFFLSGLFLFRQVTKSWTLIATDRIRTLAYPYFVWSAITATIQYAFAGIVNHPYTPADFVLIFYKPIDQFWFLYVLFVLTLTVSALLKLGAKPWAVFILAVLIYPGVLPISYGWGVLAEACNYAIYLALGLLLSANRDPITISRIPSGWLVTIILAWLLMSFFRVFDPSDRYLPAPFLAVGGIAGTIAISVLSSNAKIDAAIRFLGRYSLEIYVAHVIALAGVRTALLQAADITAPAPHLVLGTLAGLYFPIALALIFNRVGFRFGFRLPRF